MGKTGLFQNQEISITKQISVMSLYEW